MLDKEKDIKSCFATLENDRLIIGNNLFSRSWVLRKGRLFAEKLRDRTTGAEWLAANPENPEPESLSSKPLFKPETFSSRKERISRGGSECLTASISSGDKDEHMAMEISVIPGICGTFSQFLPGGEAGPKAFKAEDHTSAPVVLEHLPLAPLHIRLTRAVFKDATDSFNELVHEDQWLLHTSEDLSLQGNVFVLEDTLTGSGIVLLKHAPLPHVRSRTDETDLEAKGDTRILEFLDHGCRSGAAGSYPSATLLYNGGTPGRIRALHDYQRCFRPYVKGRDGVLISNTWGDRSQNTRLTEDFVIGEINSAQELGVEAVQVDDGWQRGLDGAAPSKTTDIWLNFWESSDNYWDYHPERFPDGFRKMTEAAKQRGVSLGLWYVVDSHDDYRNWEQDARKVLELYREADIEYFKLDGVVLSSRKGETNFRRFIETVLEGSGNRIVMDLDITAGKRHGYFGLMENGPLYIENRYTDWHNYWPHHTLRNLWSLAHYVDPLRMRFEFLNNERNSELYKNDPLAPSRYSSAYLFASVMFCSPLAFLEAQHLSGRSASSLKAIIKTWKKYRDRIFNGTVFPIGQRPDGNSWTGFASVSHDNTSAVAVVLRELHAKQSVPLDIPFLEEKNVRCEKLAGDGTASFENGKLRVEIPSSPAFLFLNLETA
jgi:alpha-galactosidase